MDRLQSMRVFSKVVEQGSFARAAQVMELSNAVVTRHVADLENHLGTRLLNRTTRKLSLTETGHAYLERVNRILADIDDADAIVTSQSKNPSGTLRIYSQLGFGKQRLANILYHQGIAISPNTVQRILRTHAPPVPAVPCPPCQWSAFEALAPHALWAMDICYLYTRKHDGFDRYLITILDDHSRTVIAWLNSPAHRQVMLARRYARAGAGRSVGYIGGQRCTIWVVRFAR